MPASMPPADTPNDLAQRESHLFAQVTDLTRRLPPSHVTRNLALLSDALEEFDCRDDIITSVDEPLKVAFDPKKGRQYFQSEYNRDQDSYRCVELCLGIYSWLSRADGWQLGRSPWSNEFYPPLEEDLEPSLPPKPLRDLEVEFNEAFDVYRDMCVCTVTCFLARMLNTVSACTGTLKAASAAATSGQAKRSGPKRIPLPAVSSSRSVRCLLFLLQHVPLTFL